MFNNALQLTLREMRALFTSPRTLIALVVVGIILGLVGPFSTFSYFRPLPRLVYWIFMVFSCYGVGALGGGIFVNYLFQRFEKPNIGLLIVAGGIGSGIPVALVVITANAAILGDLQRRYRESL